MEMCPRCDGGEIHAPNCPVCGGSGFIVDQSALVPEPLPSPMPSASQRQQQIQAQRAAREAEKRRRTRSKSNFEPPPPLSLKEREKRERHARAVEKRRQKTIRANERWERMTPEERAAERSQREQVRIGRHKKKKRGVVSSVPPDRSRKGRRHQPQNYDSQVSPSDYQEEDASRYMGHTYRDHGQFGSMPMHDDYD